MSRTRSCRVLILLALACTTPVVAGPLDPPSGPIVPTNKTLTEVEPRIAVNATNTPPSGQYKVQISKPGSYYLTADVVGGAGEYGILINASNVTLDLNGFSIIGSAGSFSGVSCSAPQSNITITNGIVRNWGSVGLFVDNVSAGRYTDLTVASNGGSGLRVGSDSRVERCIVRSNGSIGQSGIFAGIRTVVAECTATGSGGAGIQLSNDCSAYRCQTTNNNGAGIQAASGSTITDCNAQGNSFGGFYLGSTCTIERCTANSNSEEGFLVGSSTRVKDCIARLNPIGILVDTGSGYARIQDNECSQNGTGIKIAGTNCFVTGNSCSLNSTVNFNIIAGNRVGTIATTPLSPAINGSSGGSSGTVDPASNFSY